METGLGACRAAGHERVVVLGHPWFYPRFGFVPASIYGVTSEFNAADEAFMALELRRGAWRGRNGTVRYEPEFSGL